MKYIDAENYIKSKGEKGMKILFVLLSVLISSCVQPSAENEAQTIVATSYTIKGSQYYRRVEKYIIEGHEYLVFSSKIANPPFVVHSESCPCKNIEENK